MLLPVFFHIPRCGGSYIYGNIAQYISQCELSSEGNLKYLDVFVGEVCRYRIICASDTVFESNEVQLSDLQINNLNIYFIVICSEGFRHYEEDIYSKLSKDINLYEFMCLRHPFYRLRSMYDYLTSSVSEHEPSHMPPMLTSPSGKIYTFIEYLHAVKFEGSWLVRNIANVPIDILLIEFEHFKQAREKLSNVLIWDINTLDEHIIKLFVDCYGIDVTNINVNSSRNSSIKKTDIEFSELDSNTRSVYLKKAKWEIELYDTLIKNKQNANFT